MPLAALAQRATRVPEPVSAGSTPLPPLHPPAHTTPAGIAAATRSDALSRTLARAVAHRSGRALSGPLLQRYRETTGTRSTGPQLATVMTQPVKPTIREAEAEIPGRLPYDFAYPLEPHALDALPLLVAEDGTIAIHNTAAEPKEFYALPRVIGNSNEQLDDVGSSFRLEGSPDQSIDVGGETLYRVRPVNVVTEEAAKRYTDMLQNICVRMAGEVMGSGGAYESEVVLRGAGGPRSFPIRPGPTKESAIQNLAHHLASEIATSPAEAAAAATGAQLADKDVAESADVYGRQVARGYMDAKAQALGINQYIRPKVGEGLATFGNPGAEPTRDYSIPANEALDPTIRDETWGYHFAGVIAISLDGDDFVTLENYNRGIDMENKLGELQGKLLKRYFADISAWFKGLPIDAADDPMRIRDKFKQAAKEIIGDDGIKEYFRLQRDAKPNEAWFFRMYGTHPGQGQTYHERQAVSGEFVNAISIRVRKRDRWVGAVNEDLARHARLLSSEGFDVGSRGEVERVLAPVRSQLNAALRAELATAERAVDDRWSNVDAGQARFDWWHERLAILGRSDEARRLRDHLRQLWRAGSATDKVAADRLLDAIHSLSNPRIVT